MTNTHSPLRVQEVVDARGRAAWHEVPAVVFAGDPAYVPQLLMQEKNRVSPKHNPFFEHAEAALFVAFQDGKPVGRVSAQINRLHQERYGDGTGHFGFFECVEDQKVADALLGAAGDWLLTRGCQRMEGPFNFSINEECGLLIEGFDAPPAMLMPHARPWMRRLIEAAGFEKSIDLFAYRMRPDEAPQRAIELAAMARGNGRLTLRPVDVKNFAAELRIVFDVFNDAWSDNWGFVPFTDAEIAGIAKEMKPIYRSDYGRIALLDGEPVGMMMALPNVNDLIRDFDGRLLPFNWAKLAWRIYGGKVRSARIPLFGLRKRVRNHPLASSLLALFIAEVQEQAKRYRLDWVEFSWILETNRPMNAIAKLGAGEPVKTYRIYHKTLR